MSVDRKSQGYLNLPVTALGTKNTANKSAGVAGKEHEIIVVQAPPAEGEPTLKDVLLVVNTCKHSLGDLCDQMRGIKEELSLVRHELQKTVERITAAEGRISQIEDDLHPMKQEVKVLKDQMSKVAEKMDEMENRLRRDNVRLVGLPEKSEGLNPIAFLENWVIEVFGKETFSQQ